MDNTPFGNFCSLNIVIITIVLPFFFFGFGSLIFCNCFLTSFSSASFSPPACALFETVCSAFLKYLKSAMITLYKLLMECALERQSRTMKEIFDSICNARVSIFRAICALQRLLFSELSSISKTRRKDSWEKLCGLWKYYKMCLLKMWCICLQ